MSQPVAELPEAARERPFRFIHIRHAIWAQIGQAPEGERVLERCIDSKGGATVAYKTDGTKVMFAVAMCHDDDAFSREIGRRIAVRRLRHKHYAKMQQTVEIPTGSRPRQVVLDAMKARVFANGFKIEVIKHGKRLVPVYEEVET